MQIEVPQSFSILILTWSWALLGSKVCIFVVSSLEKVIDDKRLCVKHSSLLGSSLLLLIREHWSVQKEVKNSAFFWKSVTNSFWWYSGIGGMIGSFYYSERFWVKTSMFRASLSILQLLHNFKSKNFALQCWSIKPNGH